MKLTTVKEIKEFKESGDVVHCFGGTVANIFPRKTGTGNYGEWSVQGIAVKDTNGGIISVKLWNQPEIGPRQKGARITITAHETDKGWAGIVVDDNKYTNKMGKEIEERVLKVTESAEIEFGSSQGTQGIAPAKQSALEKQAGLPQMTFITAKREIAKMVSLYYLARRGAVNGAQVEIEMLGPEGLGSDPDAVIQSATSCVFIEAVKNGLHTVMPLALGEPNAPKKQETEQTEAPEDPDEAGENPPWQDEKGN